MTILIASISGRALAAAARRAGETVAVADFFGDLDTRALASWVRLPGDLASGVDRAGLPEMLRRVPAPLDGIVCGSGFEADPTLLDELAVVAPLLGNNAATVATLKDEQTFAALLDRLGLPHPRIAAGPVAGERWLRKKRGGAGGAHVKLAAGQGSEPDDRHYFQERVPGRPVSALFVANGSEARILGFSAQWAAPTASSPFRYGGCVGPVAVPPRFGNEIAEACTSLAAAAGLVGLCSLDMLVDGDAFTILELNPRPGATLDVFDRPPGPPLWRSHLDGVAGLLPSPAAQSAPPQAAAIVSATEDLRVPARLDWPNWCTDLPAPGSMIREGEPVCTVHAESDDAEAARTLAEVRVGRILRALEPLSETA